MRTKAWIAIDALQERIASLEQAIADLRSESRAKADELQRRSAAEFEEWRRRALLLEKLLTGTSAARPPGAARALAQLANPAISVIVPTYNRGRFVVEAIASVQQQSFRDWELIVVDDGSSDDTAEAVARFFSDGRIRYVSQENAGPSAARNRGLAETVAPLVAYLDNDNLWYPDFLARAVDCLATESDVDLVYGALVVGDSHVGDPRCILWRPFNRDALLSENFIDTNVMAHRRSLVARFGGWDQSLRALADWDLVLRYTTEKPARPLNVLAAYYRRCDDRRISEFVPSEPEAAVIRRKWFPARDDPGE